MIRSTYLTTLVILLISCGGGVESSHSTADSEVRDSVRLLTESIAKNVSKEGPVAWLRYFEDAPNFFMASEGQLVFPDYDSAKNFINHVLIKSISNIQLQWSNIRIDPLSTKFADIAANFHEDLTDSSGKVISENGYFTAIAHQTSGGWKLCNAHWSTTATH